jgi:hypothetical protein
VTQQAPSQTVVLSATQGAGRLRHVAVASDRTTRAASCLVGRTPDEALKLVPLLFPICGMAQTAAGLGAIEQAMGVQVDTPQRVARDLLVAGERAVNLAWRVVIDWAPLAGQKADPRMVAEVKRAVAKLPAALGLEGPWAVVGGVRLDPRVEDLQLIARQIDRLLAVLFPEAADLDVGPADLQRACTKRGSVPARLVAESLDAEMRGFGGHDLPALGVPASHWFDARLGGVAGFGARPTRDGTPAEASALGQAHHPRVVAVADAWGRHLAARLFAAAHDLVTLGDQLIALARWQQPATPSAIRPATSGAGTALAMTARGPLAHRVVLAEGRIADWRTVAPTEWNFHPDGPYARALKAAPVVPDPLRAARLLAASFDPCVPLTFDVVRPAQRREAGVALHA